MQPSIAEATPPSQTVFPSSYTCLTESTPLLSGPSRPARKIVSTSQLVASTHGSSSSLQQQNWSSGDLLENSHDSLGRDCDPRGSSSRRKLCSSPPSTEILRRESSCSHSSATFDSVSETEADTTGKRNPEQDSDPISRDSFTSTSRSLFPNLEVSLRLQNSGSVARDHLASERTFLAYMRTSLAIASSGVALVQLFSATSPSNPEGSTHRLRPYIRPLGASTIGVGILVLLIGAVRYFKIQSALTKGYFPVARMATGFIAVMLTVLVTLTFSILLAGKLEPGGK